MTTLAAIETNYAGCRFRSRLEARWAVFFDHLAVEWQYEPQGYTVGPAATPYLPDFWLPRLRLWVEVKGQLDDAGLRNLVYAASGAGLPLAPGESQPCPPDSLFPWRQRILLLGQVPVPGEAWIHSRIDVIADDLVVRKACVFMWLHDQLAVEELWMPHMLNQYIAGRESTAGYRRYIVDGYRYSLLSAQDRINDAYRAARSARFEHGESGAP